MSPDTTERLIRAATAAAVVGVVAVTAVVSYEHAYALVAGHGETSIVARLVPLTIDGLIFAASMVLLDSARRAACLCRRSPRVPSRAAAH